MTSLQDLYEKYKNAVIRINIDRNTITNNTIMDNVTDDTDNSMFSRASGFLINFNNKIYCITCTHVILINNQTNTPYRKIYGTVNNVNGTDHFRIFPMRIVGVDVHSDIAVLEFKDCPLNPVTVNFGNNRNERIGNVCWTSGNLL